MEVWVNIKGFEGVYQISNIGRLKSFHRRSNGEILSNINKKGDYLTVILRNGDLVKHTRIHRLVAEAFIPNPYNKPEVNHKDGNKQNNRVDNLEWVTSKENVRHAVKHNPNMVKHMNKYNQIIRPRMIHQLSLDEKLLAVYWNAKEASEATGVCQRNILQVASKDEFSPGRVRKQAGGYIWRFRNEGRECGAN